MTNKEKYRILCETETSIPLFSRDWWLDGVCKAENWDILLIEKEEQIVATFPFYMPQKGCIYMPAYTQTMGIWFNPSFELKNYSKELYRKQTICKELIEQLPNFRYLSQNFDYTFNDWLPFHWEGFSQTTRYSYILPNIKDKTKIWDQLSDKTKRNINGAKKKYKLTVKKGIPIEDFLHINSLIFERQGKKAFDHSVLKKIIELLIQKGQGDIWGIMDENNNLHSTQFLIWEDDCIYSIAGGPNPSFRKTKAHSVLIWEIICEASDRGLSTFNFLGSMLKGVEYFNRSFGAVQVPYFNIYKGKLSLYQRVVRKIDTIIKAK